MSWLQPKLGAFPYRLLVITLLIRLLDLLICDSLGHADEYYQSVEVAHNKVFGNGFLTWEWRNGLRSYWPIAFISLQYQFLRFLGIDTALTTVYLPRLTQTLLSAVSDCIFIR
jgi:phosphatidylinositol glycan class B